MIFLKLLYYIVDKFKVFYYKNELKAKGAKVGKGTNVYGKVYVYGGYSNLKIGKDCTLNQGVFLGARGGIEIGDNVRVSPNAMIISSGLKIEEKPRVHFEEKITIGNNVWIASGSLVSAGVTIGENSIIGACSVVTKDVPPNSFYAGVPAKLIKKI